MGCNVSWCRTYGFSSIYGIFWYAPFTKTRSNSSRNSTRDYLSPLSRKKRMDKDAEKSPWYDVVFAFTAMYVTYHKIFFFDSILQSRISGYSLIDILSLFLELLWFLKRREGQLVYQLSLLRVWRFSMPFSGNIFRHRFFLILDFQLIELRPNLWYRESGVFGTPIQISAKFIYLFLFFGVILVHTPIGKFFNDIAFALTGRFTGGTAKAAVVASALQGTVSGSSVGNTVASGSFTIPMMKKAGFKPEFAGATEAAASTGGQIMPPMMGRRRLL